MKQLSIAFKVTLVLTLLTGVVYPLLVTGLARALFPRQAGGSMIQVDGARWARQLIGQRFTRPGVLPRPSLGGGQMATTA